MKGATLDDLLGPAEPNGTFHDAVLLSAASSSDSKSLVLEFEMCVGDPDSGQEATRERRRLGRLKIDSCLFWVTEADLSSKSLITDDGPLEQCPAPKAKELLSRVEKGAFAWYMYFSDSNSFAFVAGRTAVFEWT